MHKRPRDRQHGDINPHPLATAQLQHAIIWKPYGLVAFFWLHHTELKLVCSKNRKCGLKGVMAWSVLIAAGRPRGDVFIGMYVDPVFAS